MTKTDKDGEQVKNFFTGGCTILLSTRFFSNLYIIQYLLFHIRLIIQYFSIYQMRRQKKLKKQHNKIGILIKHSTVSYVNVSYLISIKCNKIISNFKELKIKNKTKSLRNQTFSENKNLNLFKCKKYVMQLISYNAIR